MNKINLVPAVILSVGLLAGCSSKPDVSDIKDDIEAAWKSCNIIKLSDIKKVNGIDHGNNYEMAFSYKLEVVKDIPKGNPFRFDPPADLNSAEYARLQEINLNAAPMGTPSADAPPEVKAEYAKIQQKDAERAEIEKRIAANKDIHIAAYEKTAKFWVDNCKEMGLPLIGYAKLDGKDPTSLSKGDVINVSNTFTMIKSEKGWITK